MGIWNRLEYQNSYQIPTDIDAIIDDLLGMYNRVWFYNQVVTNISFPLPLSYYHLSYLTISLSSHDK